MKDYINKKGLETIGKYINQKDQELAESIGEVQAEVGTKQDTLISGTNIKTINGDAILGSGDLVIDTEPDEATELEIRRLFRTEYSITTSITNGTYSGDSSIWTEETATVTLAADTGYNLPDEIAVSGASYVYTKSSGLVALANAEGNVTISAACPPLSYSITTSVTNGSYSGDSTILPSGTASITITPDSGYKLPDTITVTGASYTFDNGVISLSNPTSNVNITVACEQDSPGEMPSKGDIITLNGESDRYRVLKVNGNVAQLMRLGTYQSSVFSSGTTKTFDNGTTGLKYEDSTLDTLLNTTYYNSLSTAIKNAIVLENRIQNMYNRAEGSSASADFRMQRSNGTWYSYTKTDQTTVGQRNVYALDASDIAEYLGTDIVYADFLNMFFEQTTTLSRYVWTSSAHASNSSRAWLVLGNDGYLNNSLYVDRNAVFPAFSIDLSKVSWAAE